MLHYCYTKLECQKLVKNILPFRRPNGPQNEVPLPIMLSSMYLINFAASSVLCSPDTHHLAGKSSCMDSDLPFVPLDFFKTLVILLPHYTIWAYFMHISHKHTCNILLFAWKSRSFLRNYIRVTTT